MSISLIQRLLDHQVAEAHQELLQRAPGRPALPAADALQRRVDPGLLHHPPGERRVQRRQGQRAVLEHFDELPAGAEQQHRAELRVEAAAEDQLVAVELGPSAGPSRPGSARRPPARATDCSIAAIRPADRLGVDQVQLHAADVGLVRDRLASGASATTGKPIASAQRRRPRPRSRRPGSRTVGMP